MMYKMLITVLTSSVIFWLLPGSPIWASPVDRTQVEWVEDQTESLANQLHQLSHAVRQRDMEQVAGHFAAELVAHGLPRQSGASKQVIKWVYQHQVDTGAAQLDKRAFVEDWRRHLQHFSTIEDVRFKVKQAHFEAGEPPRADATIYFSIVGRDSQERRRWVESKAHIEAYLTSEGGWLIDHFEVKEETFKTRFAAVDLFSEVSLPAGVYRAVPPFGAPGNQDFVAHGVAVADVDRDSLVDIFVTGSGENFLYINQGDGTFVNRAEAAGLQFTPTATAPLFVDFDNDGDSDLFLAAVGFQMLFENRPDASGALNFIDISAAAGVAYPAEGFSAVSADINNDGWPDIYVASYNRYGTVMPNSWARATNGTPNRLFVNQGGGRFVEAASLWGVADSRWSYAAHFGDVDGDGRPDLYVANDFGENALYLHTGDRYRDVAAERGVLDPGNGMGVSLGDYDNDGDLDLHVTNMSSTAGNRILRRLFPDAAAQLEGTRVLNKLAAGNTIFENLGGGHFKDVTAAVGPLSASWAFGGGFVDVDNDGWEDLHVPNGFVSGKSLKDT